MASEAKLRIVVHHDDGTTDTVGIESGEHLTAVLTGLPGTASHATIEDVTCWTRGASWEPLDVDRSITVKATIDLS